MVPGLSSLAHAKATGRPARAKVVYFNGTVPKQQSLIVDKYE
tara:strand:- start:912 stop:1037 length:126 start_codon:yes stop_codon:yes gene_type:complete